MNIEPGILNVKRLASGSPSSLTNVQQRVAQGRAMINVDGAPQARPKVLHISSRCATHPSRIAVVGRPAVRRRRGRETRAEHRGRPAPNTASSSHRFHNRLGR